MKKIDLIKMLAAQQSDVLPMALELLAPPGVSLDLYSEDGESFAVTVTRGRDMVALVEGDDGVFGISGYATARTLSAAKSVAYRLREDVPDHCAKQEMH